MDPYDFRFGNLVMRYGSLHKVRFGDLVSSLDGCELIEISKEWIDRLPDGVTCPNWITHVHILQNWYFYKNKCKKELEFKPEPTTNYP